VTDWLRTRVLAFTSAGGFIAEWGSPGTGPGEFDGPGAVAVDATGNVYVADAYNYRIQKFGTVPTPTRATTWGRLKRLFR
jgi:DNA-binding beta-propeller fold protein YncE